MNPVISPERFFESEDLIDRYQGLTCWLLYSDMHKTLWKFIRENWHAIDEMSGYTCLICVIDSPSSWGDPFWSKANIEPEFGDLLNSKPFNRNDHLKIARSLGVKYNDMPAFVFFPSVRSTEKVLVKIDKYSSYDDLTGTFSSMMDCVKSIFDESRFRSETTYDRNAAIREREQCLLRLQPEINRRRLTSVLKRIVTPTSVLGAAQVAASL
ncbi:MAG: hypothetical protein AAGJ91_04575 [Pseudomonadota bacterium]